MTASDILTVWRAVRPVFKQPKSWLVLLAIAEAGEAGMTRAQLRRDFLRDAEATKRRILKWKEAGIIKWEDCPNARIRRGGRAPKIATITPKGMRLLRLDAAPAAAALPAPATNATVTPE